MQRVYRLSQLEMCLKKLAVVATVAIVPLCVNQAGVAATLTLSGGDSVTVSAVGTVGILGGSAVNNATTTYSTSSQSSNVIETDGSGNFTLAGGGTLTTTGHGDHDVYANGSGAVVISGGNVSLSDEPSSLNASIDDVGTGPVIIEGGAISTVNNVAVLTSSTTPLDITGGTIAITYDARNDDAGPAPGLVSLSAAVIDLFGTGFVYNDGNGNQPITSGDLPFVNGELPTITGTLLNGDTLNTTYYPDLGTIEVNVGNPPSVPEPTSATLLVASTAGVLLRRKR